MGAALKDPKNEVPKSPRSHRSETRRQIYMGEGMRVRMLSAELQNLTVDGEAVDLSPFGLGIVVANDERMKTLKVGTSVQIEIGTKVFEQFRLSARIANTAQVVVSNRVLWRIGLSFVVLTPAPFELPDDPDTPALAGLPATSRAFRCPDFFQPIAYCQDPFFFQERMHFQVDACAGRGLRLVTSIRNKSLLPNLKLQLILFLPLVGPYQCTVIVRRIVQPEGLKRFLVDVELKEPEAAFLAALAEFLLLAGSNVTIQELKDAGFVVKGVEKALSFSYVSSQQEMDEVLRLRELTITQAVKGTKDEAKAVASGAGPNRNLVDAYDEFSRQILCKIGGRFVATMRVIFPTGDRTRSELHALLGTLPDFLLRGRFIEASRLSWHPDYREGDILLNFIRHLVRITAESGHRYLLTAAQPNILPLYQKLGFKSLGKSFASEFHGNMSLHVIVLDVERALGKPHDIDPTIWQKVYAPVARHVGFLRQTGKS